MDKDNWPILGDGRFTIMESFCEGLNLPSLLILPNPNGVSPVGEDKEDTFPPGEYLDPSIPVLSAIRFKNVESVDALINVLYFLKNQHFPFLLPKLDNDSIPTVSIPEDCTHIHRDKLAQYQQDGIVDFSMCMKWIPINSDETLFEVYVYTGNLEWEYYDSWDMNYNSEEMLKYDLIQYIAKRKTYQ